MWIFFCRWTIFLCLSFSSSFCTIIFSFLSFLKLHLQLDFWPLLFWMVSNSKFVLLITMVDLDILVFVMSLRGFDENWFILLAKYQLIPSRHLLVQSQPWKHQNNVWIYSKLTIKTPKRRQWHFYTNYIKYHFLLFAPDLDITVNMGMYKYLFLINKSLLK